jgi:hypothetical protein
MALREADPPAGPLYHIGRLPNPLAWTEWEYVGGGRFDDPRQLRQFRVLYAAEQRLAAFVETLQKWRPSIEALAALNSIHPVSGLDDVPENAIGVIPADWGLTRGIATFHLLPGQHWLDLREHETRETLRGMLAPTLQALRYDDFDLSDVLGRDRRLTQTIAWLAHEQGFHGITYTSRFSHHFTCWAIFEGADFTSRAHESIAADDADFLDAVRRFNLRVAQGDR